MGSQVRNPRFFACVVRSRSHVSTLPPHRDRRGTIFAAAALVGLFAFRLGFGLSSEFFFEDETQIFLNGLRHYTTGQWPYFGPDVVWTKSEIPGALQGVLISAPLGIVPAPESPFVLLNLLSFAALAALAWYATKRIPSVPRWLVWGWFLSVPWVLQFSTHITNPSYVLPAAIVFFLGFFEATPVFTLRILSRPVAHFMMGAALTWVMQIHMSWPLLLAFAAWAWISQRDGGWQALARDALAFVAGALLPGVLLLPTLIRYGFGGGSGGVGRNLHFHVVNPWFAVTTLARVLSFASLEISRFLGTDGAKRTEFLLTHWWLAPLAAAVWVVGIVQPVWMLLEVCRAPRRWPRPESMRQWKAMRRLLVASIAIVFASYSFVMEPPQAHAFYVLAPVALLLAAYCWTFIDSPRWRRIGGAALALNLLFHGGLAIAQAPVKSLYKRRPVVMAAIRSKHFDMLGHRRPFAVDAGPYAVDPAIPQDPRQDIAVRDAVYTRRFDSSVHWTAHIVNRNARLAYRDLLYIATYIYADGARVERHEFIKDIFEPCEGRVVDLNDGFVRTPFTSATFTIVAAEALIPADATGCEGSAQ
jgi:hypothetical protein